MTFKIIERPEFTIPVSVPMPGGTEQELMTSFIGLPEEEVEELDWSNREAFKSSLSRIVTSFHDVEDPNGKVHEIASQEENPQLFELLLSQPNVRVALLNRFHFAMAGAKGARRGN
jgi:hypothetical protein